ncbi:polysaccharide deacetylase family protein [Streptomyces boninensis]|uniref:polysaccharide deacetylase family protein n=1 Tax=Streptomyces boninensis TaxID=2039455 RepID=UPI003B21FEA3
MSARQGLHVVTESRNRFMGYFELMEDARGLALQPENDSSPQRFTSRRTFLGASLTVGLAGAFHLLDAHDAHSRRTPRHDTGSDDAKAAVGGRVAVGRRGVTVRNLAPLGAPWMPVAVRRRAHKALRVQGRKLALTFDDGPNHEFTPEVLKVLRRHDVRATFFVIGENTASSPDLLRAIVDDGHVIGNHTWSHPRLDWTSYRIGCRELERTSELIDKVLGWPPRLARAPYAMWTPATLKKCAALGMVPWEWTIDSMDYNTPGTRNIIDSVLLCAHPGAIVLAHDGGGDRSQTVAALEYYLPRLLDRGYTMVQPT